jgi:porphobilinogen synthase
MIKFQQLRKNRKHSWLQKLIAETSLRAEDFIMPFFVIVGKNKKEAITSIPGQFRFSIDLLIEEIKKAKDLGIKAIMLFPCIAQDLKDKKGSEALNKNNLICQTIYQIKKQVSGIGIIADVALDPYTTHGHDGIFENGEIKNDPTVEILCQQALIQSQAGCDIVSPSDMMDGRVLKIRQTLDQNYFQDIPIASYTVKYASNLYGAFRNAVGSSQVDKVNKATYQMDFSNIIEARREIKADIEEGADMLIIKPAGNYLDIIKENSAKHDLPIFAYQVSGEYAMLKFGAQKGIFDFHCALFESLISIKRAGARAIITYGAMEFLK